MDYQVLSTLFQELPNFPCVYQRLGFVEYVTHLEVQQVKFAALGVNEECAIDVRDTPTSSALLCLKTLSALSLHVGRCKEENDEYHCDNISGVLQDLLCQIIANNTLTIKVLRIGSCVLVTGPYPAYLLRPMLMNLEVFQVRCHLPPSLDHDILDPLSRKEEQLKYMLVHVRNTLKLVSSLKDLRFCIGPASDFFASHHTQSFVIIEDPVPASPWLVVPLQIDHLFSTLEVRGSVLTSMHLSGLTIIRPGRAISLLHQAQKFLSLNSVFLKAIHQYPPEDSQFKSGRVVFSYHEEHYGSDFHATGPGFEEQMKAAIEYVEMSGC
ncbi:hypothetical protein EJ08DRAFT_517451 [Tothia fuscella]|uniref:Uncharacterized protein n=1 Tax=Tothia fuscella TaxID=1048955 RepID=A0A9P4TTX4_9PEZI|nr:hypothetical protein EJ08DRAFT_517451 [Tothia fuscella]